MPRFLLILLVLLQSFAAYASNDSERERALQQSGFVDPSAHLQKVTVSILPFDTAQDQPDMQQYGAGTMDSLISSFSAVPNFIMVDRGRVDRIIKEQALAQTGLVDPKTAVKLGKLVGAQALISGSIQSVGSGDDRPIEITANFVNVETGQITASKQVKGTLKGIFDLQEQLAGLFIKNQSVTVTPEQQQRIEKVLKATANLTAYDYYLKGRKAHLQFSRAGYAEAIQWYQKAIEVDPKYALAFTGLAETWALWGYQEELNGEKYQSTCEQAYKAAQEALALNPDLAEAHRSAGLALAALGKHGEEAEDKQALALNPNDAEAWFYLWNSKNPDDEYILRALKLNPDLVIAHVGRGIALDNLKRYDEAIAEFKDAIRINPDSAHAFRSLGDTLADLKRLDEAATEYKEAIRLEPNDAHVRLSLGEVLQNLKRYEEAATEYKEAIRLDPTLAYSNSHVHYYLGLTLLHLNRYEDASAEFKEVIRIDPDKVEAHFDRGLALYNLEQYPEAIVEYQKAIKLYPGEEDAHYNLALALQKIGKNHEAADQFELYLKYAPRAADTEELRATIRNLRGK